MIYTHMDISNQKYKEIYATVHFLLFNLKFKSLKTTLAMKTITLLPKNKSHLKSSKIPF